MIKALLRDIILSNSYLKRIYTSLRSSSKKSDLIPKEKLEDVLSQAEKIILDENIKTANFHVGLVLPKIKYEGFVRERDYYTKYERFLMNNNISYGYYDPYKSNWIE